MPTPPGSSLRHALLAVATLTLALGTAYAGSTAVAMGATTHVQADTTPTDPTSTDPATPTDARGARPVPVPVAGRAVNTSSPDHVIGHGTPASCTSRKVVRAVARGGVITFNCGPSPVVIHLRRTAKVHNTSRRVVIDGGGLVTLSGNGSRRILYENACDPKMVLRLRHCQSSPRPRLVVQHLTLADGNSSGNRTWGGGGGAILSYGGQLKIVDSTFLGNRCDHYGADLGGGAVRARYQYRNLPVYVVGSTFRGGRCSNGAALSSINVSWTVLNSIFASNAAIGYGANPQRPHTRGGGSGGAIYTDGERYVVHIAGTTMTANQAREGGGAVFFVSNDRTGTLHIHYSTLASNLSERFATRPGVFYLGHGPIDIVSSILN